MCHYETSGFHTHYAGAICVNEFSLGNFDVKSILRQLNTFEEDRRLVVWYIVAKNTSAFSMNA